MCVCVRARVRVRACVRRQFNSFVMYLKAAEFDPGASLWLGWVGLYHAKHNIIIQ